jgi:hypothetical protein
MRREGNRNIHAKQLLPHLIIVVMAITGCIGPEVVNTPDPNDEPERHIPPRPGTLGIIISGPRIEIPLFAIDESRGVTMIEWERLMDNYPSTDITVPGHIDTMGTLRIDYQNINIGNHEDAWVNVIEPAMRTWQYTPVKSGPITFWYNLPSMGVKLTVFTDGLNKTPRYRDVQFVRTGYLFHIGHINRRHWTVQ